MRFPNANIGRFILAGFAGSLAKPSESRPQTDNCLTTGGRVLTGLLAESTAETITLLDAKNKRTVLNRKDVDELQESAVSLMPEKLLDTLTDQQLRDLFAYLPAEPDKP